MQMQLDLVSAGCSRMQLDADAAGCIMQPDADAVGSASGCMMDAASCSQMQMDADAAGCSGMPMQLLRMHE